MRVTVTAAGLPELRAKMAGIAARLTNLEPPLLKSGIVALKAAQERIDAGGPGWPPNKTGTPLLHRTGNLIRSLSIGASDNIDELNATQIRVGTAVYYAGYNQYGTGARAGRSAYRIFRSRKDPKRHPGVETQGIPPRPFLFVDDQMATVIGRLFGAYVVGKPDVDNA